MEDRHHVADGESLLQFVYQLPVAVFRMNGAGSIDLMNPRAVSLLVGLGLDMEPDKGWNVLARLDETLMKRVRAALQTPGLVVEQHAVGRQDPQGRERHLSLTIIIVNVDSCMVSIDDITQRVNQERELGLQRQNMSVVLETVQGYFVASIGLDLKVLQTNRSIKRVLGYGSEAVGKDWRHWFSSAANEVPDLRVKADLALKLGWSSFEAEYVDAAGCTVWGDTTLATIVDEAGDAASFVAVVRDISAGRQREVELTRQALTDPLTGLLNRRGLAEHLAPWLAIARTGASLTLSAIALDIDFFKRVNDTHGHDGGDEVLRQIGVLLPHQFRRGDLLARLGGEEFVVILRDTPFASVIALAERLRQSVERTPIDWHGAGISITSSIGVAMIESSDDAEELLRNADAALYRAKSQGRNQVVQA